MEQTQQPGVPEAANKPRPTHLQAIGLIIAIIVVFGIYIGVLVHFGIFEFWSGILFFLYWSSFEHMDFDRFLTVLAGALAGLAMAYMFVALPQLLGMAVGGGLALAVVVIAVYCLLMGWLPFFINTTAMLFLTVGGIPSVQHHADFASAFIALAAGAAFFWGLVKGVMLVLNKRGSAASGAGSQ